MGKGGKPRKKGRNLEGQRDAWEGKGWEWRKREEEKEEGRGKGGGQL